MAHKSRAHQIRSFVRRWKNGKESLRSMVELTAMVAACEERSHCLAAIKANLPDELARKVSAAVCRKGVMEVLGFSDAEVDAAKGGG